jgi:exodeoxyribonuclease V alpha subunit
MGQLESIGCGNIACDMINSDEIPTVYLSQVHRQAQASAIVTEARKIRKGIQIIEKDWTGNAILGELQDLSLDCYSDKNNTFYKIMQVFSTAMSQNNFNIMETQIIVPIKNNGSACTWNINNTIQELYNPSSNNKLEIKVYSQGKATVLRQGDKVINTQNTYKTNPPIYNGNIGIIKEVYPEDKALLIDFMGIGKVYVEGTQVNNIELGYAITVHKSQGSQFDHIIFGIDFSSYSLLTRELLYTAITRAKIKCDLIAQTGALRMAVNQEGVNKKQTHLQDCLYQIAHPKLVF